ncbi:MAG: aminopeptidase P family protein [Bacteroidales bacterium]|nr:aminopeptidase P family protein [Bacteroidales bacterium]MBQ5518091.1 aminopeptidase P family protein [Bacteroidales bacterium]MBQ5529978.1 aminopeptidase P family protein [Bacteroidales bacterium]
MVSVDNKFAERIAQIRSMGFDAVVISGTDPHNSEYPAPRWKQVEWACGFTGEAGDLVVTPDHAGLWTDSRYFIQANAQLAGTGVELHKTRVPEEVPIPQWLAEHFQKKPVRVAFDGLCQSVGAVKALDDALRGSYGLGGYELIDEPDMLSKLWNERPAIPHTPVEVLDERLMGETRREKLTWLRGELAKRGCGAMFVTSLDEIAWLLNVRASDIDYNPYVISFLLVTPQTAIWFVRNVSEVPVIPDVVNADYSVLEDAVDDRRGECGKLFIDPSTLNYHTLKTLRKYFEESQMVFGDSPIVLRKAIKNKKEIEGFRRAFIEDGVAMENFLYWLETSVQGGARITEWDASEKMTYFRSQIEGYRGNSFENISAYGANAALPHYSTPRAGSAEIKPRGLYLCDSGGQYLFGTTDITRTVPMGRCSRQEKEDYTLVLKGMIDLTLAVFPAGTAGCQIDALARRPLWATRRNFGHGTGHGIGFYLGVHEGPQTIRQNFNPQPLVPGMISSNEPGLYREGKHGVRHENVVLCREEGKSEFGTFLSFETLTCCHIETSIVMKKLLNEAEWDWLKAYNRVVYRILKPRLAPEVAKWLKRKCR